MSTNADRGALQSLLRMLQADPANASLRSHCVNTALSLGDYQQARELVEARLRDAPTDPAALFDGASILIARKRYTEAIPQLAALLASGQRHPGILRNSGLCHYCLGDFAEAHASLEEAYERGDRSAGLLRLLVSTVHHLGMLEKAVALADANGAAAKDDAALAGVFALVYLDDEQSRPAATWARTALQLDPRSVDGLVVQGTLHVAEMRTDDAKREFEQALERAPEAARAWLGLGTLALLANNLDRAKELLGKAAQHSGKHVGTLHMVAWTHLASGDLARAEQAFADALALNRNFAESHGGVATAAAFRGDRAAAERAIAIAERLDPGCLSAKLARAVLLGGDPAAAKRMIAEAAASLAGRDSSALARVLETLSRR